MGFVDAVINAVKTCFSKYACFEGRASRSEYWYFTLFNVVAPLVVAIVFGMIKLSGLGATLCGLYSLAAVIPSLAAGVRRLHDSGKSGWFLLVSFIPLIGGIWLLILLCTPSNAGANQYGEDPHNQQVAE